MESSMSKKKVQAAETHIRILKEAVRLFARQGYHKTTIADLAQAVQLTSGAIFHHFSSKEALLEAVVDWLARGIQRYSNLASSAERGSLQVVQGIIEMMCDHFKRNPEATLCLAMLATEFAGSEHPVENRIKAAYEVFIASFSRALREHPDIDDPEAAAIAFMGSVQGIAVQGLLREREMDIDRLAGAFMSMFTRW
jgi:AcrR family transcriptional regulator